MSCKTCQAKGWDHDKVVAQCKADLYTVCLVLCQFERMVGSRLHKVVARWLQRCYEQAMAGGKRKVLLMMARDFLKTSLVAAFVVWRWINDPEERYLLIHASSEMSSKVVPLVERILLSGDFQHFFGDLVPDPQKVEWNKREMTVNRVGNYKEASLEARGINSTVTGGHFTGQLHDDPIDEIAARSPVDIDRAISFYQHHPYLFDDMSKSFLLVTATWWEGGYYEHLIDSGQFEMCIIGARVDDRFRKFMASQGVEITDPDGSPIWPEFFPKKVLDDILATSGPVKSARQMDNRPATESELRFKREDFRYFNWGPDNSLIFKEQLPDGQLGDPMTIPFRRLEIAITVDPATGENLKTDPSAINVSGWFPKLGLNFCLEEWAGIVLPDRLIEKIFELAVKWKKHGLLWVGPEEVSFQMTLKHFIKQEMQRRGVYFRIRPITVGSDTKAERIIDGLQPFVANHQCYFLSNQGDLLREMVDMRIVRGRIVGKSPNRVDALAMHSQFWKMEPPEEDRQDPREDEEYRRTTITNRESTYGARCLT